MRVKDGNKRSLRNCWSSQLIMTRKSIVGFGFHFVLLCTRETRRERRGKPRSSRQISWRWVSIIINDWEVLDRENLFLSSCTHWLDSCEQIFCWKLGEQFWKSDPRICSEFESRKTSQNAINIAQLYEVIVYDWQFREHFSRIIPLKRSLGTFSFSRESLTSDSLYRNLFDELDRVDYDPQNIIV